MVGALFLRGLHRDHGLLNHCMTHLQDDRRYSTTAGAWRALHAFLVT